MKRRKLLQLGAGGVVGSLLDLSRARAAAAVDVAALAELRKNWQALRAAGTPIVEPAPPLARGKSIWHRQLPTDAYDVLFEEGTERPFSSALNEERRVGLYVCRACDLPLFTTAMKYDSGTGWPSFFTSIEGHFDTKKDFQLVWPRTEYHCIKCGGHHGHMFDDGPAPTGQRWCNNGVALKFIPLAS